MTHVHMIGIGGSGLSAIAQVLLERGFLVSGSDRAVSPLSRNLVERGARVTYGHRPENVTGADLVIRSSAIPDDNVEVQAALKAGIPVYKRMDFLGQLTEGKQVIAIAGTHGKTTTTAMIAWVLTILGQDPSFIIGGISANLGSNAHAGEGPAFVIEADEYDHMFLGLLPTIAVVTNIEHDHPDCYPTPQDFFQAFEAFSERLLLEGTLVGCADDAGAQKLMSLALEKKRKVISYGIGAEGVGYQGQLLEANAHGGYDFILLRPGEHRSIQISLQVPGEHNVRNALAAMAVADLLGLPFQSTADALGNFRGTGRRFELRGEANGVLIVDDYAHHPTEIRATLAAARGRYSDRRIWVVWQPHTYSRTRTLFDAFAAAFGDADHVVVLEIYAARESPPADGFSALSLVEKMKSYHHAEVVYAANLAQCRELLLERLEPGDAVLVLSAGDADQLSSQLLAALEGEIPWVARDRREPLGREGKDERR